MRVTDVVKHLLIINVIVFFGAQVLLGTNQNILYLYYPQSEFFKPYQLVTHMFMHGGTGHLIFNMLSLFFLGPLIEYTWKSKRFLFYYLFCGFGAMLTHMAVWYLEFQQLPAADFNMLMMHPGVAVVGASGAIYGVFIAIAMLFPNVKLMLLFPPIPIKAKYLALGLIAYDLISGLGGFNTGVAHFAHLGGALFGFLLIMYWRYWGGGTNKSWNRWDGQ